MQSVAYCFLLIVIIILLGNETFSWLHSMFQHYLPQSPKPSLLRFCVVYVMLLSHRAISTLAEMCNSEVYLGACLYIHWKFSTRNQCVALTVCKVWSSYTLVKESGTNPLHPLSVLLNFIRNDKKWGNFGMWEGEGWALWSACKSRPSCCHFQLSSIKSHHKWVGLLLGHQRT